MDQIELLTKDSKCLVVSPPTVTPPIFRTGSKASETGEHVIDDSANLDIPFDAKFVSWLDSKTKAEVVTKVY
jgi:hypothetical protein